MRGLVSIIIPMYNVEKYIERCLESIEGQLYHSIQIICIDDGSTDATYSVVLEYQKKSSRNMITKKVENGGVSVARNLGIQCAEGEFVCFVDADDMLERDYITTLLRALESNDECDVAICRKRNVGELEDITSISNCGCPNSVIEYSDSSEVLEKMLYHKVVAGIWNLLVRRELLVKNNLKFAEGYAYSEDLQLVWKIVACSNKVALIPQQLYLYRIRNSSAMTKFDFRRKEGFWLFKELEIFIREKKPNFSPKFDKYGVAYWVWSTIWQAANLSDSFHDFIDKIKEYEADSYIKKLLDYPNVKVRISSRLFLISKKAYYVLLLIVLKGKFIRCKH